MSLSLSLPSTLSFPLWSGRKFRKTFQRGSKNAIYLNNEKIFTAFFFNSIIITRRVFQGCPQHVSGGPALRFWESSQSFQGFPQRVSCLQESPQCFPRVPSTSLRGSSSEFWGFPQRAPFPASCKALPEVPKTISPWFLQRVFVIPRNELFGVPATCFVSGGTHDVFRGRCRVLRCLRNVFPEVTATNSQKSSMNFGVSATREVVIEACNFL